MAQIRYDETNTHVLFSEVNGFPGYSWGKIGNMQIQIRECDGYVNISKFIAKYKTLQHQKYTKWSKNSGVDLLKFLTKQTNKPVSDYDNTAPKAICGTFVHPDICYAGNVFIYIYFL